MEPPNENSVRGAGRRAYRAVAAAFLIHSTVSGTWAPRLPAIKESLGLSDGELGTALVGLAIGLLVGTRLAGAPVDRFGSRPVMRAGFPLLAATLVLPVASLVFMRGLLAAHRPAPGEPVEEHVIVRWTPALVLLGVIAFCSFVAEGAASDWSAVYMTQELGSSEALGAVAFAAFAVTMAIARFAADPLRGRVGNLVLVRGGSLIAAIGLGLALLVHEPAAAISGFALLGLGLAPVVPIAFSAAGNLDARATGRLVGRVATLGYVGSVAGPIMIGWLAEATSLRTALGLVVLLSLTIAACARVAAPAAAIGAER